MKNQFFPKSPLIIAIVVILVAANTLAQDATTSATVPNVAQATATTAPQLSYGVPQVLQLEQAKVSDNTVVTYIQNSGTIYALDASQIVYLKQQGVSDSVINAMLNQRKNVTSNATQSPPQQNSSANAQTSTAVGQPSVAYAQPSATYVPSSTVYVIPDTQTYYYNANYYRPDYYQPYYGGYYYPYPAVSFSLGFGGYRGGNFRGGWGGGWHHR
jgi:hypothetical protein